MVDLLIHEHQVHPWHAGGSLWVRGWFYDRGHFYEGESAHRYLIQHRDRLESVIPQLNGMFALVVESDGRFLASVDRIRTFPLFVGEHRGVTTITDRVESLPGVHAEGSMDAESVREYLATGFVTGSRTLYEHVRPVEAGQFITVTDTAIHPRDYYTHRHTPSVDRVDRQLSRLDEVVENVFERLVRSLNGRPVTLLLSGGYDSRLVAVGLRRAGYENVTCLSFGKIKSREVKVARQVASDLNYRWHHIDVPRGWLKRRFSEPAFQQFVANAGNGISTPYYMGLLIERALDAGVVDRRSVVVTGNSGDVVEGAQIPAALATNSSYLVDDLVDVIIHKHYMQWGKRYSGDPLFRRLVVDALQGAKPVLTRDEALDLDERFNWRERQAKYVVQDARCYEEVLGMDWRFPLWDNEFVDFWLQVPAELRIGRRLYFSYVEAEPFSTANVVTKKKLASDWIKKRSRFLTNSLYPLEKLRHFLFSRDPYYVVGLRDYIRILRLTGGYRTTTFTTHLYREMREIYAPRLPVEDPTLLMRSAKGA